MGVAAPPFAAFFNCCKIALHLSLRAGYVPGFEGANLGESEGMDPWDADMQRGDQLMGR